MLAIMSGRSTLVHEGGPEQDEGEYCHCLLESVSDHYSLGGTKKNGQSSTCHGRTKEFRMTFSNRHEHTKSNRIDPCCRLGNAHEVGSTEVSS